MFIQAIIAILNQMNEDSIDCYPVAHLNSPSIQHKLENIDELDYIKIANLGLLLVREIAYTKAGGIIIYCKKVRDYYGTEQIKKEAST